jgi:hypothetical protein
MPNDIDQAVIGQVFAGWHLARITRQGIASGTRRMPVIVVRLSPWLTGQGHWRPGSSRSPGVYSGR